MPHSGFWSFAHNSPSVVSVIEPSGKALTAGELVALSHRLVHGLRARGCSRGDCIAMALPNSSEVLALFMAATQAGMYLVPINWHLTAPEIAYVLQDSNAKIFIGSGRLAQTCRDAAHLAEVPVSGRFAVGEIDGFAPFSALIEGQPSSVP